MAAPSRSLLEPGASREHSVAGAAAVLAVPALGAGFVPACRTASVNPIEALGVD